MDTRLLLSQMADHICGNPEKRSTACESLPNALSVSFPHALTTCALSEGVGGCKCFKISQLEKYGGFKCDFPFCWRGKFKSLQDKTQRLQQYSRSAQLYANLAAKKTYHRFSETLNTHLFLLSHKHARYSLLTALSSSPSGDGCHSVGCPPPNVMKNIFRPRRFREHCDRIVDNFCPPYNTPPPPQWQHAKIPRHDLRQSQIGCNDQRVSPHHNIKHLDTWRW